MKASFLLPQVGGVSHLPGVPHLHVKKPLERVLEPLKFLSLSGIRGTRFISIDSFPTPSCANQCVLNFDVMAVRDIKLIKIALVEKCTLIS